MYIMAIKTSASLLVCPTLTGMTSNGTSKVTVRDNYHFLIIPPLITDQHSGYAGDACIVSAIDSGTTDLHVCNSSLLVAMIWF